jgi:hypothetical protein
MTEGPNHINANNFLVIVEPQWLDSIEGVLAMRIFAAALCTFVCLGGAAQAERVLAGAD